MTEPDADLDKRAEQILQVVRQCWRLLSDLQPADKAVALAKLDDMVMMEAPSMDPAYALERRH
jgi:hypothetical protein